jgi:hypothetical protein
VPSFLFVGHEGSVFIHVFSVEAGLPDLVQEMANSLEGGVHESLDDLVVQEFVGRFFALHLLQVFLAQLL